MTVQQGVTTAAFRLLDFGLGPWLGFIAVMIVAGFAGTMAGGLVLNRMGDARFHPALEIVLILIALRRI